MAQLIIKIEDNQKAKVLSDFLGSLPYISSIEITDDELEKGKKEDALFSLAGIWEGRDVSQQSIRNSAWRHDQNDTM